ncbi:MAG: sigma 54-interacting transcriptional regulator [Proteobacteria bacterium]|nr:sigma 54-interacting transcriptional regulator [Pseudomonadota bacterium]MBU1057664.1 sigma 54-interacting transcriptional regulator [Pseudomonadota bacterium]
MKPESLLHVSPVFSELLNAIPHGIAFLDTNLCIVVMNRFLEVMTGYGNAEARGVYSEFILRSNLGNKNQMCREVLESGESVSKDGNIINRQRKKIPVHFTLSCLHDEQGQAAGFIIVLEDMSVLKSVESKHQGLAQETGILGHSPQMAKVFELMSVLARTDAAVLITGETGTGKDMIAEALHESSQRARQPFIKVNCGALPEALLESELFGHVKGAFTGAVTETVGMFRLAHKGTIFLTEIGDLSLPLQVKLLSVLDDQEFFPVGGSKKVKVDVRIIAATHCSLRQEVQQGHFREDLFYRLNVLHLHMPPLREREGDIRLLLDHFLRQFSGKLGRGITSFTRKAMDVLSHYHYPGNVRELRNIAEYSANICQGKKVGTKDLPQYLFQSSEVSPRPAAISAPPLVSAREEVQPMTKMAGGWTAIEKEMMVDALRKTGGNRSKAADLLGWGRTTLWRKLKKYEMA